MALKLAIVRTLPREYTVVFDACLLCGGLNPRDMSVGCTVLWTGPILGGKVEKPYFPGNSDTDTIGVMSTCFMSL